MKITQDNQLKKGMTIYAVTVYGPPHVSQADPSANLTEAVVLCDPTTDADNGRDMMYVELDCKKTFFFKESAGMWQEFSKSPHHPRVDRVHLRDRAIGLDEGIEPYNDHRLFTTASEAKEHAMSCIGGTLADKIKRIPPKKETTVKEDDTTGRYDKAMKYIDYE